MRANMTPLLAVADLLTASGLSVIPIGTVADKRPDGSLLPRGADGKTVWKPYQSTIASHDELARWFGPAEGIGIVGGTVSGNLTILDFDVRANGCIFDTFAARVEELSPGLIARFPVVRSQRGGRHLYFRCTDCGGPTLLARDSANEELIATKAQGGYCVAPQTAGYKTVQGSLTKVPTITPEERALLFAVARSYDEKPPQPELTTDSLPGAAYNTKATLDDMEHLLLSHGWQLLHRRADGTRELRRPGKLSGSLSATLGQAGHKSLYNFSPNAQPFEANRGYSAFAIYAVVEHGGDYSVAASQLLRDGYGGKTAPQPKAKPTLSVVPPQEKPANNPHVMKLSDLLNMTFPETKEVIPGIIQEGTTLFTGKPKSGKSWTMLHFSLVVAYGGAALGSIHVDAGDVLHLALEDGPKLLAKRFKKLLRGGRIPDRLEIATEWSRLGEGGLAEIEEWLQAHPKAAMVVIDTLQAIRGNDDPKKSAYRQDYDAIAPLTNLAHKYSVALVIVHHTRKMEASDVFDTVSGTLGLTGAVDAIIVMERQRFAPEATLSVTGRDIEEHEIGLTWDKDLAQWNFAGTGDEMRANQTQQAILDVLNANDEPMGPRDVAERSEIDVNRVKTAMWRMEQTGALKKIGYGKYRVNTGNSRNFVTLKSKSPVGARNFGDGDDSPDDGQSYGGYNGPSPPTRVKLQSNESYSPSDDDPDGPVPF